MAQIDATRPLQLEWTDARAARYACLRWHYSSAVPTPPLSIVGVWEFGAFVGVVIFSRGASRALGTPYGLGPLQVCELTRIALTTHKAPVSRIIAIALRMLKQSAPALRLVVSFADANEGHHGGIYQASNWVYSGLTAPSVKYVDRSGREWHSRQVAASGVRKQYGQLRRVVTTAECTVLKQLPKHRYLMPLDKTTWARIIPLSRPFPKRDAASALWEGSGVQSECGGSTPTQTLQDTCGEA